MTQEANMDAARAALAKGAQPQQGQSIAQYVGERRHQFMSLLGNEQAANRLARVILMEVRMNPVLGACSAQSIVAAAMTAAQLRLEIGGALGQAYLIPYAGEAQFQLGYKGTVALMMRSPNVVSVEAVPVFTGDDFYYRRGTDPVIHHVPAMQRDDEWLWDDCTHVYAVFDLVSQSGHRSKVFEVMTKEQIDKHFKRYVKAKKGPWYDKHEKVKMALKTVLLQGKRTVPMSAETEWALAQDGAVRREIDSDMMTVPPIADDGTEAIAGELIGADAKVLDETTAAAARSEASARKAPAAKEAPAPEPVGLTAVCTQCGVTCPLAPDVTAKDVPDLLCDSCGGALKVKEG